MTLSDIQISDNIKNGHKSTFEAVFKTHYKMLCKFAIQYVKNTDTAEEIVQSVFYNIWKNKENFTISQSIKAYLFTATRNNCLQYLNHKNIERKYVSATLQGIPNQFSETPLNTINANEINAIIEQTLNNLPENCSKIFKLNRFENLKYNEIADILNISVKTVEANITKALKAFRINLSQYLHLIITVLYTLVTHLY